MQEGIRFRAFRRAHILARLLIDEKGEFSQAGLGQCIHLLETEGYLFYADGLNDASLTEHMLATLKKLRDDSGLIKQLKRFQKPLCHTWAEDLVRHSLGIYQANGLTEAHIRIAVLSALLTPLRQNVGSCFATAPAIFIQRQEPENLMDDLYQLLTLGKLKRVFDGVEYVVPLSPSTGIGDLRRPLIYRDDQSQVWLSPGLMRACEAAGLIQEGLSWEEKGEKLKELIGWELQGKNRGLSSSFSTKPFWSLMA